MSSNRASSRGSPVTPASVLRRSDFGTLIDGGLAPAIMAIVERGVRRRPAAARALNAEVELNLEAPYPPVRILFGQRRVLVEDGASVEPDLRISATLADLVHMMVTPLLGGMPSPVHAHGRGYTRDGRRRAYPIRGEARSDTPAADGDPGMSGPGPSPKNCGARSRAAT